ncbi:MAG: sugar phosphate nucleotidyltransferase, partial [Firmicutes bacterium]|nr:sugar phosphate nucleotidyltransferase [Bacillota bacterium]
MKGLILCAGHGLGLLPFTLRRPKSLVPVANKPILHYSIHQLLGANINDIGIVIGPKGDDIKNIINDYNFPTLYPTFLTQQKPAGIAAAVAE